MKFSQQDEKFMGRAIELARRGNLFTSPNPMVGAVLVKNGKIIAEGWHKKFGGDHAEIAALAKLKKTPAKGAIIYINLEPCAHFGKTPPCVDKIIAAGVNKVVMAMKDPNPLVCGRGIAALKKAGIKTEVGCLRVQAQKLNEKFIKWISKGVPFVAMKVAMTLDGKIATRTGDSKWITSKRSRAFVRELRDSFDGILVGVNTVLKDNPALAGANKEPVRIVLDSHLCTPLNSKILRNKNVIIITTDCVSKSKTDEFVRRGLTLKIFNRKISITPLLRFLGKLGISSVLVEGGSEVFGSFIDSKSVDKFYWFIAPKIIGGKTAKPAVGGKGVNLIKNAVYLKHCEVRQIGADILIITP